MIFTNRSIAKTIVLKEEDAIDGHWDVIQTIVRLPLILRELETQWIQTK